MMKASECDYDERNISVVIYPVSVDQVMVVTVNLSNWWLQLNNSSIDPVLAVTLYQENPDRSHKLQNML